MSFSRLALGEFAAVLAGSNSVRVHSLASVVFGLLLLATMMIVGGFLIDLIRPKGCRDLASREPLPDCTG